MYYMWDSLISINLLSNWNYDWHELCTNTDTNAFLPGPLTSGLVCLLYKAAAHPGVFLNVCFTADII